MANLSFEKAPGHSEKFGDCRMEKNRCPFPDLTSSHNTKTQYYLRRCTDGHYNCLEEASEPLLLIRFHLINFICPTFTMLVIVPNDRVGMTEKIDFEL